ncbi:MULTISPECIES: nitroreductase [Gemmobacter]|jgi:nitroreductase|uniref:Putative NAD(P)H nitroreductase n=2 Tax=Gemmobacter TaxID=204456 RepID=A0A2T6BBW2_9RHOB|nr:MULTISPECIES: nitroreductase [Gemmobacter]OJY27479.1 MAG: nitroreductase [Rhodobacterales bacterium 65-51]PTX53559.1 nitroreductase [Gemmobacter caeni]TWJ05670.1 nitroreductase [Gemmobacter caeni]
MTPNPAALDFLLTRRSRPAKTLTLPVPTPEELAPLLTAALRVPDHGKLEPWRLLVLTRPAMARLADMAEARARETGGNEERIAKGRGQFDQGNLAVVVISSPKAQDKVPEAEQILSAGCVCLGLVNAALAAGWGASWLTGWVSHDRGFAEPAFGLAPQESVAGIVHIGTETSAPPERPRPDVAALTRWVVE